MKRASPFDIAHLATRNFIYTSEFGHWTLSPQKRPTNRDSGSADSDLQVIATQAAENPSGDCCNLTQEPCSLTLQTKIPQRVINLTANYNLPSEACRAFTSCVDPGQALIPTATIRTAQALTTHKIRKQSERG